MQIHLEQELLKFLKQNNPQLWMPLEMDSENSLLGIVDEQEYFRRINNPCDNEEEEMTVMEEVPTIDNPYTTFELDLSPGVENFDQEILDKSKFI